MLMEPGRREAHILELDPPAAGARIPYGPGRLSFGDLRLPGGDGPHPVVLVVHGGFWRAKYDLEHTGHLAAALTAAGLATWNVEYRRIGDPGGGWPGTLEDVARAADHLRELAATYALDLDRAVAVGHSAGGHLALWLAARHKLPAISALNTPGALRLRGVVALAPVADLRRAWELGLSRGVVGEFLGGGPDEFPERYAAASPIELLPLGIRQVLIHGTRDDAVPYEIAAGYRERAAALGDDVTLLTLEGTGHFEVIDPRSAEWARVVGAVLDLAGS